MFASPFLKDGEKGPRVLDLASAATPRMLLVISPTGHNQRLKKWKTISKVPPALMGGILCTLASSFFKLHACYEEGGCEEYGASW